MKEIRIAHKVIRTLVKDQLYYPGRFITDTFIFIAQCGVLLALYHYVFRLNNGVINGTVFGVAAWSIFFYFAFHRLRLHSIYRTIMKDIRSGDIEIFLSKPVSYLLFRAWWQIGSGMYSFLMISLVGTITLSLILGLPQTMMTGVFVPTFIITALLGMTLTLLMYTIIGLLAFWIEDTTPVFWVIDKTVMILGGSYLPVALFPDFMSKAALYSPFGASLFITHTVNQSWSSEWMIKASMQIFWICVTTGITYLLYSKARRRVFVNGG